MIDREHIQSILDKNQVIQSATNPELIEAYQALPDHIAAAIKGHSAQLGDEDRFEPMAANALGLFTIAYRQKEITSEEMNQAVRIYSEVLSQIDPGFQGRIELRETRLENGKLQLEYAHILD